MDTAFASPTGTPITINGRKFVVAVPLATGGFTAQLRGPRGGDAQVVKNAKSGRWYLWQGGRESEVASAVAS